MPYYRVFDNAVVMSTATFSGATSGTLQTIFSQAISSGLELVAKPGIYDAADVVIDGPISVHCVPGKATLRMTSGASGILYLGAFSEAEFHGLIFDGNNVAFTSDPNLAPGQGLVNMRRDSATIVSKARFVRCKFLNSTMGGIGVNGPGIVVEECVFNSCADRSIGVVQSEDVTIKNNQLDDQDHAIACSDLAALNVTIEGNIIRRCRRNGITMEPSGSTKVDARISICRNKISKLDSGDDWAVSRTNLATTGAEGNGILAYLSEHVVISDNDVSDCEFSAIRTNVSSDITISGNVCTGSGETAIYVESPGISVGEFRTAVTGNVVQGGGSGISVVNYDYDGKLSAIAGNVVRDIEQRTITYTGGSYSTGGSAIYVEANAAVSGNTIQNAYFGIALGTNDYTSDLNASGNVVRETTVAIAVSSTTPTEILVASNLLAGYSSGAIKAFAYTGGIPPYSIVGSELCPANRGSAASGKINMIGNVRRAIL